MTRARLLLGVATGGAAALVAAGIVFALVPPRSAGESPAPVVLAVANALMSGPLLVAERQGYFAEQGLTATLRRYPSGKEALEALLRGGAEVATVAETPLALAATQGERFSIIANLSGASVHVLVARADRGIRRVADLRGRRVGVMAGTTAHYFLHVLLSDAGLEDDEIEMVPLGGSPMAAELASGRVDAVATFEPYSTECREAMGGATAEFRAGLRYQGFSSLVTRRGFSEQRPETVHRLLRAIDRANNWTHQHRHEAASLIALELAVPLAVVEGNWEDLNPELSLDQSALAFLEKQARWAFAAGLARGDRMPNFLDAIDASALDRLRPEAVTVVERP